MEDKNLLEKVKKLLDQSIQVSTSNLDFVNGKRDYTIKNKPFWSHNFNFSFMEKILYQQSSLLKDQFLPKQDDFIVIKPRIESDENWLKVNTIKNILIYFTKKYDLETALYSTIYDSLVFPFGVLKVSWSRDQKEKVYLDFSNDKILKVKEISESIHPNFESIDPTEIYVSNKIKDLKELNYVIHKRSKPISELIEQLPEYADKLKSLSSYDESNNSTDKEVEVIEYYTLNSYALIIDNEVLVNRPSVYKSNILPFFFFRFIQKPRTIAGNPLVSLVKDSIAYMEELLNLGADNTLLSVLQLFLLKSSSNLDMDNFVIQPGAVLQVNNNDDFKPIFAGMSNAGYLNDFNLHNSMINDLINNITQQQVAQASTAAQAKILTYLSQQASSIYFKLNRNAAFIKLIKFLIDGIQQFIKSDDLKLIMDQAGNIIESPDIDLDVDVLVDIKDDTPDVQKVSEIERLNQLTQILNAVQGLPEPYKSKMLNYVFSLFNIYDAKANSNAPNNSIDANALNSLLAMQPGLGSADVGTVAEASGATKAEVPSVSKGEVTEETYAKVEPKRTVEKIPAEVDKYKKEAQ